MIESYTYVMDLLSADGKGIRIRHVTLVTTTGTTILVPDFKSNQDNSFENRKH